METDKEIVEERIPTKRFYPSRIQHHFDHHEQEYQCYQKGGGKEKPVSFHKSDPPVFPQGNFVNENHRRKYNGRGLRKDRKEKGKEGQSQKNDLSVRILPCPEIEVKRGEEEESLKDFFSGRKPRDRFDMHRMDREEE